MSKTYPVDLIAQLAKAANKVFARYPKDADHIVIKIIRAGEEVATVTISHGGHQA